MNIAIKIIQVLLPLVIDLIREAHADKCDDEHKQIARDLIDQHFKNKK